MLQPVIGIIFDFDETLAPDSTSSFLDSIGIDVPAFWKRHAKLLAGGWDPIPAYLQMMVRDSRDRKPEERITRDRLVAFGSQLRPYHGVVQLFTRMRKQAAAVHPDIAVEFYIVSSGVGDIIRSAPIAKHFTDIWASDFSYNNAGEIDGLKNVVSFTDKTRFIFQISKGIVGARARSNPFLVNEKIPDDKLRMPFDQIIAVGDGFTDVPCFSLVQKFGGIAIGVYDRDSRERWGKAWGFVESHRVTHIVAADYRKRSGLDDALSLAVDRIAKHILLRSMTYQG